VKAIAHDRRISVTGYGARARTPPGLKFRCLSALLA
jgi:hypothetical protein